MKVVFVIAVSVAFFFAVNWIATSFLSPLLDSLLERRSRSAWLKRKALLRKEANITQETQPGTESSLAEERKSEYTEADREEVRKQLPWLFRQKWLLLAVSLGAVLYVLGDWLLRVAKWTGIVALGIAALLGNLVDWAAARLTLFDVAVLVGLGLILGSLARIRRRLDRLIEEVQQMDVTAENRMEQGREEDDSDA